MELLKFESESEGLLAKRGDVMLVGSTDPAYEAVNSPALRRRYIWPAVLPNSLTTPPAGRYPVGSRFWRHVCGYQLRR